MIVSDLEDEHDNHAETLERLVSNVENRKSDQHLEKKQAYRLKVQQGHQIEQHHLVSDHLKIKIPDPRDHQLLLRKKL